MNIKVNGYDLSPAVISGVTEGTNANERLTFTFDTSWDGLIKTVTFYTPDRDVVCLVAEDTVLLPTEVTEHSGVTRYVICGTDGEKTVMSAEGAVRISDTLNVDDDTFERKTPGAIETITRYIKKITDAYDAAYANAQNVAHMAESAESAASAAGDSRDEAVTAQTNAENSASRASESAQSASQASDAAQASAESANTSAQNAQTSADSAQSASNAAHASAESAITSAQNAQSSAETANSAAQSANSAAQGAYSSAQSAQSSADSAYSFADSANSASSDAYSAVQRCEEIVGDAEYLKENLTAHIDKSGDFVMEYGSETSPEAGKIYLTKRSPSVTGVRYLKRIFVCSESTMYYAWKDGDFMAFTKSKTPAAGDVTYISGGPYSIEQKGSVKTVNSDGTIYVMCVGRGHTCRRMPGYDERFGAYGWEPVREYTPIMKINSASASAVDSIFVLDSNTNNEEFDLGEFYARVIYKRPSDDTTENPIEFLVSGMSAPIELPVGSASERTFLIHGEFSDGMLFVSIFPENGTVGCNAGCVVTSTNVGIRSFQITRSDRVKLGYGTKVDIWGRYSERT